MDRQFERVEAPAPAPVPKRGPEPLRAAHRGSLPIQAKLVVGAADDSSEREADAVAEQVMTFLATGGGEATWRTTALPTTTRISPMSSHTEEVDAALGSPETRPAESTRISRMKLTIGLEGGDVDAPTEREINAARSGGMPLEGRIRPYMEQAIGADFSGVRVHVGSQSDALNERIQAKAFTTGSDIFVRQSDYAPGTKVGQTLLAHELAHTVQQGASVQRAPKVIQREFTTATPQAATPQAATPQAATPQAATPAAADPVRIRLTAERDAILGAKSFDDIAEVIEKSGLN